MTREENALGDPVVLGGTYAAAELLDMIAKAGEGTEVMDEFLSERDRKWMALIRDTDWHQEYMAQWQDLSFEESARRALEDICDELLSLAASDWYPRNRQEWEDFWDMLSRSRVRFVALRNVLSFKYYVRGSDEAE